MTKEKPYHLLKRVKDLYDHNVDYHVGFVVYQYTVKKSGE
jgi:hypothetical protein